MKKLIELIFKNTFNFTTGLSLIILSLLFFVALLSYSPADPCFNVSTNSMEVGNILGIYGSYTADFFIQIFGLASFTIAFIMLFCGKKMIKGFIRHNLYSKLTAIVIFLISTCALLEIIFPDLSYSNKINSGGVIGIFLSQLLSFIPSFAIIFALIVFIFLSISIILDLSKRWWIIKTTKYWRLFRRILKVAKKIILFICRIIKAIFKFIFRKRKTELKVNNEENLFKLEKQEKKKEEEKIEKIKKTIKEKKLSSSRGYILPYLDLLMEGKNNGKSNVTKDELVKQSAELAVVLKDFGIKGDIIDSRAGPIITLHEFEPSPGTKSSRVIALADDIARSMSAVSARISVLSGRNALGIEIPNKKRETIFLRSILETDEFQNNKADLPIVLGTDISGKPVIADLARMPHLLVAGTTGSGKSVSINTMILSILYKMHPDNCKFIMIDPKMLELSVYEGIPHLLIPVVTESSKAVIALKWIVKEMEDRYRTMAALGVRNIKGYNEKLEKAQKEGRPLTRHVQVGYDNENDEPIYEEKELDSKPMPYIIVVVDEMADLMITAGKEIEASIQRLAQMARAAGIHIIMATQRPSVDVITGVIKANFPTRISFQVTSKIDSRTILGEQGAEQLLGMGDMLYMAGGGKITRAHGPFVSDDEIEEIVSFIKKQGFEANYKTEVLDFEDNGSEGGNYRTSSFSSDLGSGSEDDVYRRAVEIVKSQKKVSISYIQRQLRIGYNKAANLVERMEGDGLVSEADRNGKRDYLGE